MFMKTIPVVVGMTVSHTLCQAGCNLHLISNVAMTLPGSPPLPVLWVKKQRPRCYTSCPVLRAHKQRSCDSHLGWFDLEVMPLPCTILESVRCVLLKERSIILRSQAEQRSDFMGLTQAKL